MLGVGSALAEPSTRLPLAAPKFWPATMATSAISATNATPHGRTPARPLLGAAPAEAAGGAASPDLVPQR
jgi:hypothetical protein